MNSGDKEKYEQELLELDGAIEVQERRFEQEVANFQDMMNRKTELMENARTVQDKLDLAAAKLQQIAYEQKKKDFGVDLSIRVTSYIKEKDYLISTLDLLSNKIDNVENECVNAVNKMEKINNSTELTQLKENLIHRRYVREQSIDQLNITRSNVLAEEQNVTLFRQKLIETDQKNNQMNNDIYNTKKNIAEIENNMIILRNQYLEKIQKLSNEINDEETIITMAENELNHHKVSFKDENEKKILLENSLLQLYTLNENEKYNIELLNDKIKKNKIELAGHINDLTQFESALNSLRQDINRIKTELEAQQFRASTLAQQKAAFYGGSTGQDVKLQISELRKGLTEVQALIDSLRLQVRTMRFPMLYAACSARIITHISASTSYMYTYCMYLYVYNTRIEFV